ncbi:Heat shock factor (HSF)-type DNA-binding [Arabidopsis thaliana x Arabidopsis arenosa]|uniref:Heat shock factor (HSF)-type DNA-binding n=1 Tax=Arabidopsis thaliana x Arabidopsis arenosa TaxID=1240361 RepID=A0A8T1XGH0_9BRAS|nr:Heat shock factor (HSF)-type DNA-binding [Arabidopsis thaliana x Arabidopsis arenosa]
MEYDLPLPLEGLKETGPTAFLTKTYNIVDDSSTNNIVSWSRDNNSFIVWEPETFALICLPRCFKHNNFSSFVRQLNTYGFKKIDTERWEFANEYFLKGERHLLKNIKRRKTSSQTQTRSLEGGRFRLEGEIHELRRDRVALELELVRLRRKQESMKTYLHLMEEKLKVTEVKQEMMMNFLLKKIKKPSFLQSLRKRKLQGIKNQEQRQEVILSHGVEDHDTFVKAEPEEYGDDIGDDIGDQFGGVFCYGDELHIASMEDQGQEGDEMEMDNEGIWKGFVLSEEMCDLGEHFI